MVERGIRVGVRHPSLKEIISLRKKGEGLSAEGDLPSSSIFFWKLSQTADFSIIDESIDIERFDGDKCYIMLSIANEEMKYSKVPCTVFSNLSGMYNGESYTYLEPNHKVSCGSYHVELYVWRGMESPKLSRAITFFFLQTLEKQCYDIQFLRFLTKNTTDDLLEKITNQTEDMKSMITKILSYRQIVDGDLLSVQDSFGHEISLLSPYSIIELAKRLGTESETPRLAIQHFDTVCSQVTEYLYLGGKIPSEDRSLLKETGITHIINCAGTICKDLFSSEMNYLTMNLLDDPNQDIASILYPSFDIINKARSLKGKTFIHCHKGISRSATVVIGYLMWNYDISYYNALEYVKRKRPISNPNAGFASQLINWRKRVKRKEERKFFIIGKLSDYCSSIIVAKYVMPSPSLFTPSSCVIIVLEKEIFLWIGEECSSNDIQIGKENILRLQKYESSPEDVKEFIQGKEPEEFWNRIQIQMENVS